MSTILKEARIEDIKLAILENQKDRVDCIRDREEEEKKLFEFLSMIRTKVTEFGKEFYSLGYTSGVRKEQTGQLHREFKKLTGEEFLHPENKNTGAYQNQFFVDRETPS